MAGDTWSGIRTRGREVVERAGNRRAALLGSLAFGAIAVRLAWMADDGAITARVIANTLAGYGPNYNITERAQAFTHPLWFWLNVLAARITGDILITMLLVGVLCAATALYIIGRDRHWVVVVAITALAMSTYALTEYAASGLENPLSWLLIAVMWRGARSGHPTAMAVGAGLLLFTRLDLALVAVPFVAVWLLRADTSLAVRLRVVIITVAPALVWLAFSWVYYGSPLPETAYSKLNIAIPTREVLGQGVRYAFDLTRHDPLAGLLIGAALGLLASSWLSRETKVLVLGGIGLYGCYVLYIGGDFMSGRFWTVSIFVALIAVGDALHQAVVRVSETELTTRITTIGVGAIVLPLLLAPPAGLPMFRDPFSPTSRAVQDLRVNDGIADEWAFYLDRTRSQGFLQWLAQDPYNSGLEQMRTAVESWKPDQVVTSIGVQCGEVGRSALTSGPTVHWVVPCALSDPLLARTEFEASEQNWRVGHYDRPIPPGYFEALATGTDASLPPETRPLFNEVSLPRRIARRWGPDVTHP